MSGAVYRYVLVFMVVILLAVPSWAASWKAYATNNVFDYSYDPVDMRYPHTFVNILSLKIAHGDLVRVWSIKTAKGQAGRDAQMEINQRAGVTINGYDDFGYSITQKEIQCNEKNVKVLSETDFTVSGQRLTGFSKSSEHLHWRKIIPDTDDDALYKVVCGKEAPTRPIVISDIIPQQPQSEGPSPALPTSPAAVPAEQKPAGPSI